MPRANMRYLAHVPTMFKKDQRGSDTLSNFKVNSESFQPPFEEGSIMSVLCMRTREGN